MPRTVVIDVVGLERTHLGAAMPQMSAFVQEPRAVDPVTPAVTCTAQATYLTGQLPSAHGIVANGWYFRDLNEIWLWRQSNRLVESEKVWHKARRRDPSFTVANTFWWYAMATEADLTMTPRPLYLADGVKVPDCYSDPPELRTELSERIGNFPLFEFWGPRTSIASSRWIAEAARHIETSHEPGLQLVYLPHLDYVLQREGPAGSIDKDLAEIDEVAGQLIDFFRERGLRVLLVSEYAITAVSEPVHINRVLREHGFLAVKEDLGREYLDPGRSRAFAVSDHQIAHVYVHERSDIAAVASLLAGIRGVGRVLDDEGKRAAGLDHSRAGELVALAEPGCWFTYYFWLDDGRAPDYARMVDIHNKPGYDPCELFVDPGLGAASLRAAWTLARKAAGFRYKMELTPLDARLVRGSHGLPSPGPMLASSEPGLLAKQRYSATEVCQVILDHVSGD